MKDATLNSLNDGFLTKSAGVFPIDESDIARARNYQQQLIHEICNTKNDNQCQGVLLGEIQQVERFIKNTEIQLIAVEPQFENITVNSFNKLAAGL
jgi:Holliday junction resolvasome RuvABC endonuclease subunit